MNKHYLSLGLLLPVATVAGTNPASRNLPQPNIILILVDDLGFSDLGCYGSEIHTPHIDRLAHEGTRFRQFYNNSISAPTRASLITGQYSHTAGVGYFNVNLGLPAYQGFINKESLTIAEVLGQGGYQTYLSGKWHVGSAGDDSQYPTGRGFDHSFGILGGGSTYLYNHGHRHSRNPGPLVADGEVVSFEADSNFHLTDAITGCAVGYVREAVKRDAPFFLYLAYTAPHWPLQALKEDIDVYRGRYGVGWDVIREERIRRQKELGVLPAGFGAAAAEDERVPAWEELTYDEKDLWARKMEVYAAMVSGVDRGVGELLGVLEETGEIDNTVIVFISDNGAPAEEVSGQFGIVVNTGTVGTAGSFESQGAEWSRVSNAPLRGYKSNAYEGGISSPFIGWWPEHIPAGKIEDGVGHIIDIAPTFYDIAGVSYPDNYQGVVPHVLPGVSLKGILSEGGELGRPLFWERAGNRAVLEGGWKLVSIYPSYKWELYNLAEDRGETKDLAGKYPEIVDRLSLLYYKWAEENDVVPFEKIKPELPLLHRVRKGGIQVY
ncbi:MAG: arylsulfatase [Tannerellaceae bacterium]|jgi:arylsulfatase|nr:arylsulfatase [Tannerellaceae bacterium]